MVRRVVVQASALAVLLTACFDPEAPPFAEQSTGSTGPTVGSSTGSVESSTGPTDSSPDSSSGPSPGSSTSSTGDPPPTDESSTSTSSLDSSSSSGGQAVCGDGIPDAGEACDDGNDDDTDECLSSCVAAGCGDGVVWAGQELCDDANLDEGDGCLSTCVTARSCGQIQVELAGAGVDGIYVIDVDDDGPLAPFDAYCDMTTDGGGWTLLVWAGDPSIAPRGLPYPGLAHCPGLACGRGSAVAPGNIPALLATASAFALAHSPVIMASYDRIGDYTYAGRYDYGDLGGLVPVYANTGCGVQVPFAQGTFTTLAGPPDYDGATVYVSHGFTYANYDYSLDTNAYIWSVGVTDNYCNGSGQMPGTYFGTWFNPSQEYGPYLQNSGGARSLWVR